MIDKSEGWVESVVERYVEWAEFVPPPDGVVYEAVSYNGAGPNWELLVAALGVLLATIPVWAWLWKCRPRKEPSLKDPRKGEKGKAELGAIGRGSERGRPGKAPKTYETLKDYLKDNPPQKTEGTMVISGRRCGKRAKQITDEVAAMLKGNKVVRGIAPELPKPAPRDDQMDAFKYFLEAKRHEAVHADIDAHDRLEAARRAEEKMDKFGAEVIKTGNSWVKAMSAFYEMALHNIKLEKASKRLQRRQDQSAAAHYRAMQKANLLSNEKHARFGITKDGYKWEGK